jgi:adenylylsulfate kinase-like enzyme
VVGIDIPWHAPRRPDMVIDAAREEPPAELAARIAAIIPERATLAEGDPSR